MGTTRRIALGAITALMLIAPNGASAMVGEWDHLLAPETVCPGQTDTSSPRAVREPVMVCMHGYARAQSGLPGLGVVKPLRASALRKARDIRRCKEFSHTACGRGVFYWFERTGFLRGTYGVGENLAYGFGSARSVRSMMSAWLESDAHRQILLTSSFDSVGISAVPGRLRGRSALIWVAHFGYRN
jgi:uncharacterized protein YkwD